MFSSRSRSSTTGASSRRSNARSLDRHLPEHATWLFARVYQDLLDEIKTTGTSTGMHDRIMGFDDVNELLGLSRWQS